MIRNQLQVKIRDKLMFSDSDKKLRLLKRLSKVERFSVSGVEEINSLIKCKNYTQAFLTQWMAVEKSAKNIAKTGVLCVWCEKAFESLHKALGDVGYTQLKLESKLFDTLYTRYSESRSSGFDTLNVENVKSSLNNLKIDYDLHKITVLLSSKPDKDSAKKNWPNHKKQTIRNIRNKIIHGDGRITSDEYSMYLPYFENYFSIIVDLKEQIDSVTTKEKIKK